MGAARGLIIEGIPGTGKSTLILRLQGLEPFLNREVMPFLLFGEEMTQRTLERGTWDGTLQAADHVALWDEILSFLERQQARYHYRGWTGQNSRERFLFLLERFHLTHATYYPYLHEFDFSSVEQRLLSLDACGCLLVMQPEVMRQRIISSRTSPAWRRYLARYGDCEEAIVQHYMRQQEAMYARVQSSALPWLVLDTTSGEWDELAGKILSYWLPNL